MTARDVPEGDGQLSNLKVAGHSMLIINKGISSVMCVCLCFSYSPCICVLIPDGSTCSIVSRLHSRVHLWVKPSLQPLSKSHWLQPKGSERVWYDVSAFTRLCKWSIKLRQICSVLLEAVGIRLTGQYSNAPLSAGSVHRLIGDHRGRNGYRKPDTVSEHISDLILHCNLQPQTHQLWVNTNRKGQQTKGVSKCEPGTLVRYRRYYIFNAV